jgi:hypothetical protein
MEQRQTADHGERVGSPKRGNGQHRDDYGGAAGVYQQQQVRHTFICTCIYSARVQTRATEPAATRTERVQTSCTKATSPVPTL